jgi:hypothetical protein
MTIHNLLIALGLAWIVAASGIGWLMNLAGMRLEHLPFLLIYADIVMKGLVALSVASAAMGVVRARSHAGVGAGWALAWGVLGALFGAATARMMLINMNPPIPFYVYAPNYATALLVLLIGLTGAILCLGLLSRRRPRLV